MPPLMVEVRGVDILGDRLRALGDEAPKAVLRALRRTRTTIITRISRWVAQASGLPVRRVQRSIHGSQPNLGDPSVTVTLWGGRDALIRYATGIQRSALPRGAFRARMPVSGHVGFFERTLPSTRQSRGRRGRTFNLPVHEVQGPPFTSFITDTGLADLLRYGGDVFKKNLEAEIAFREGRSAA